MTDTNATDVRVSDRRNEGEGAVTGNAANNITLNYRSTIVGFLQRAKIPVLTLQLAAKGAVESLVLETTKEWAKKGLAPDRWQPFYKTGFDLGTIGYGHTRFDVQAQIALFSILGLCIDDFLVSDEALDCFSDRLLSGSPQLDPILDCMVDNLSRMHDFFPPYAAKTIILSAIAFIDATLHDKDNSGTSHHAALPYVNFRRMRSGMGEIYHFFIWDKFSFPDVYTHIQSIPEIISYLNFGNDILSFHKEQLAGEKENYIHRRAIVTQKDVDAVLIDVVNEVVEAVDKARAMLVGEREKKTFEMFLKSYAAFHYMTPRYKLAELLDGERILC
ncbi:isoprenoid synthase domain-containing protein [Cytidiella melzeri]|nr:isoprenoid synthase domain-containing protein [Cytidiella melzeri]